MTFNIEDDPNQPGTPLIHMFKETNPSRTAAWFRGAGGFDSYYNLRLSASQAGYGSYSTFTDGENWLIVGDIHQFNADGTISGKANAGAGAATGSGGGVCVSHSYAMAYV